MFVSEAFTGLGPADRQVLDDWFATATSGRNAKCGKIDRVIDFTGRPWNVSGLEAVMGVFEAGQAAASWLLVRYEAHWVLAQVGNGTEGGGVSEVCDSLADALGLIGTNRLD